MVQTSSYAFGFNTSITKEVYYLLRKLRGSAIGILEFVIMGRKAVEIVNEAIDSALLISIVLGLALPVRAEDYDRLGTDLLRDFAADGLELGVGGVFVSSIMFGPPWERK